MDVHRSSVRLLSAVALVLFISVVVFCLTGLETTAHPLNVVQTAFVLTAVDVVALIVELVVSRVIRLSSFSSLNVRRL